MIRNFFSDIKSEFAGYNLHRLSKDLLAGLTVAAVALPLALAFGVSSGADAAAGLITAILAGFVISALSGASYQISGPTGAMTAVLATVVSRYQLQGVFIACFIAGAILLIAGIFKLGKLIAFIPAPVITGFTSGIAVIIALGQIDNFFGTTSQGETAIQKLLSYGTLGFDINWQAVLCGVIVIAVMLLWPKSWNARVPSSLVGIIVAGVVSAVCHFDVATVGTIPQTLFPENRLDLTAIDFSTIGGLISPAFTIAALGMIESLLCGASASRMKKEPFNADRELLAQGIGNMLIPFFGGVPATAAIARTSVAIKSGSQTRLTGVFHAVGLLLCMFLLGPIMAALPLSALAGVLMVTAWRMNEWESIRYIFSRRFGGAILKFLITMIATVVFDLTVAIIIGVVFSIFVFVAHSANIEIGFSSVKNEKLKQDGADVEAENADTLVVYVTGPIFFGNVQKLISELNTREIGSKVLFSMRGVTSIDTTGVQLLTEFCTELKEKGTLIQFCGVQSSVRETIQRAGLVDLIGEEQLYWSVDQALLQSKEA